ncbi:MAG TPA: glycosyltransferase family 39 protein [Clostridiaceae bacterium]
MFSLKEESKRIKIILLVICLLFFSVCLFSIFYLGNSTFLGNLNKPDNDDVKFVRSALILASSGKYIYHYVDQATTFMMPGVSYTLAFLITCFGKWGGLTAFRIIQAMLQTGCLLLVFFLGRKLFGSRTGIIAVILSSLCIADVWVSNLILTETFFKFFVLSMVLISLYAIEKHSTKFYILAGLCWGIATIYRPTIALFPGVILIMWLIKKYKFKEIVKYTLLVGVVFSLVLSPWWIRNYSIFHKFIPLTRATGNPMAQGTYINYDQSTKATDGLDYSQFVYQDSEVQHNDLEMKLSKYRLVNLVPKEPLKFLYWYTIGKTISQINWPFYWNKILGVPFIYAGLFHYATLLLALIGMIIFARNKNKNKLAWFPFITIIYFIVVYLPFFTSSRYFYPAIPYVMIFAAVPINIILERKFFKTEGKA